MSDSEEFIFNNAYCERVKRFCEETQMSAADMAELLGIPADRYRKYETRSPLPAYLIARFCKIVGCDLEHLVIGKPRERMKPAIVARKSAQSDLVRLAQETESTPGGHEKLEAFARAVASRQGKRDKTGT